MNSKEGLEFTRRYFYELFEKRNLEALDDFLDEAYFDDDIGDPSINHRENSKEYLSRLFVEKPTVGVNVIDAMERNGVISAFLEWFVKENGIDRTFMKGVAIFVVRDNRIIKRHTFIYFKEE